MPQARMPPISIRFCWKKKKRQILGGPVTSPTRKVLRMKPPSFTNATLVVHWFGDGDYGSSRADSQGALGVGSQPSRTFLMCGNDFSLHPLVFKSLKCQSPTLLVWPLKVLQDPRYLKRSSDPWPFPLYSPTSPYSDGPKYKQPRGWWWTRPPSTKPKPALF